MLTTTTTTPRGVFTRALPILKRLKRTEVEYREMRRRRGWSEFCPHGRYIGTWAGPDILCGYCEDGTNVYTIALSLAWQEYREAREGTLMRLVEQMFTEVRDKNVTTDEALKIVEDTRVTLGIRERWGTRW